jgi:hypothetical protein
MNSRLRKRASLLLGLAGSLVLLAALGGCAGYQIGNQSLYPCHIRTVYVPMFQFGGLRQWLAERLTEAVMKEIELKTPYKVVSTADADSILAGRIGPDTKRVAVRSTTGDPRSIEISMLVFVTWTDRSGNVLREDSPVPVSDADVRILATSRALPEVGGSIAIGQQQAIDRVAQQIVALMEAPW